MNEQIVFILFVVIVVLITYFNLFRYFKIHFDDENSYIYEYKNIPKFEMNNKVIVSFTTSPSNLRRLKPMIKSLLDQTVRIDQIVLNIPDGYDIPGDYEKMINIYKCGMDYGEGTKCIPTILREGDYGTVIIMLNDEYVYGSDFLETLLKKSKKYPSRAIASEGALLVKPEFFDTDILAVNSKVSNEELMKYLKVSVQRVNYNDNFKIFI
jgi:hypothetical protein